MKMRNFTEEDFWAFGGCETDNPQINEEFKATWNNQDWDGMLVRDGETVEITLMTYEDSETFIRKFDDEEIAQIFCEEVLPDNTKLDMDMIVKLYCFSRL